MESSTAERTAPPSTGTDPRGGFEVYPMKRDPTATERLDGETRDQIWTGEYGWRFRSANGQITAVGGEGFGRRQDAERAVFDFLEAQQEHLPPVMRLTRAIIATIRVKHVEE